MVRGEYGGENMVSGTILAGWRMASTAMRFEIDGRRRHERAAWRRATPCEATKRTVPRRASRPDFLIT